MNLENLNLLRKILKLPGVCSLPKFCKIVLCHIFGRMCLIVFLAFTLKFPIQTLLSVAPSCSVFWCSTQFKQNETSENKHTLGGDCSFILDSPRGVLNLVNFGCFVSRRCECFHYAMKK